MGGRGAKIFSRPAKDAAFCSRRRSRPTLKPHSVEPHARARVGGDLFSTASGPVSTVLRCSGCSILVLVRGLAPFAALLCCYEPCPHDPRRCGLNSCPSYMPMPCAVLPQLANFPLVKSTVLPCRCTGLRSSLEFVCRPPFLWTWCHGWVGGVPKFFPDLRRTLHFAAGGAQGPH